MLLADSSQASSTRIRQVDGEISRSMTLRAGVDAPRARVQTDEVTVELGGAVGRCRGTRELG